MVLFDELKKIVSEIPAELNEKKGIYSFEVLVAERKAFLSRKKLTYSAKFRINEEGKEVKFTEMLKESGSGLSSGGGGFNGEMSAGFGFKTESYNTLSGAREGNIEEQSNLFGKKYEYKFDFGAIRKKFEEKAKENGYQFSYQITSIGL
ncbi:MAG: hypothetical protein V1804_01180 [Patescibacteria group bacterium]